MFTSQVIQWSVFLVSCLGIFDDAMKFEYLKFLNLIFSRMERAFEVKQKTFFQASQSLPFRLEKQARKNVADTTFKQLLFPLKWSGNLWFYDDFRGREN